MNVSAFLSRVHVPRALITFLGIVGSAFIIASGHALPTLAPNTVITAGMLATAVNAGVAAAQHAAMAAFPALLVNVYRGATPLGKPTVAAAAP